MWRGREWGDVMLMVMMMMRMMMMLRTSSENVCSRVFSEIQSPARAGPMRRSCMEPASRPAELLNPTEHGLAGNPRRRGSCLAGKRLLTGREKGAKKAQLMFFETAKCRKSVRRSRAKQRKCARRTMRRAQKGHPLAFKHGQTTRRRAGGGRRGGVQTVNLSVRAMLLPTFDHNPLMKAQAQRITVPENCDEYKRLCETW